MLILSHCVHLVSFGSFYDADHDIHDGNLHHDRHHHHGNDQQHGHEFEEGLLCVGGQLTNMQPIRTRKLDNFVEDEDDDKDDYD